MTIKGREPLSWCVYKSIKVMISCLDRTIRDNFDHSPQSAAAAIAPKITDTVKSSLMQKCVTRQMRKWDDELLFRKLLHTQSSQVVYVFPNYFMLCCFVARCCGKAFGIIHIRMPFCQFLGDLPAHMYV